MTHLQDRQNKIRPRKGTLKGIVGLAVLVLFFLPALSEVAMTLDLADYKNYFQLYPEEAVIYPLGKTLHDGTEARVGRSFYLVSAYIENKSAYDAYFNQSEFSIKMSSVHTWPEELYPEAEGPMEEWSERVLIPSQREKQVLLLFQLPDDESLEKATLVYPFSEQRTKEAKLHLVEAGLG